MFSWNFLAFPDPAAMNLQLKTWGFHPVNIMEPMNRTEDPLHPWLAQAGYYLTGPTGLPLVNSIWYGEVSWLDMSKSAVRDWYSATLQSFMGTYHIDGVWNDLNEPAQNYMPEAVYDFDGQPRTDLEARNLYALQEAKTSYEAQVALRPNQRPWIFSRSGFSGLHRYGANWGGDADTSFASLRTNVEMSLSMGLSGQPFFGHDIGGFLGSPSPELFLRWMTFSAYTPLFRNHAMNTSARREPWAFGEPYLSMIRNIINERYRLIPYIYSLFHHDATLGAPVIAPLPFHFKDDPTTFVINDEFMLGQSMLVAPVLDEGATGRWLYLPNGGDWIHERTDVRYAGGQWIWVDAAIDQIPVFLLEQAIIPRAPVAQSTAEQPLNRRSLDLYCDTQASQFDLYEDDGMSLAHEQGDFLVSRIACTPGPVTTLGIERTQGTWQPPADRQWSMTLHRTAQPSSVRKGGVPLAFVGTEAALAVVAEGWAYSADQRVIVKVSDQATPLAVTLHHE
jgi:alpha-glucosidase